MTEFELSQFCWDLVDNTIDHVFLRFPEDGAIRANIYRKMSEDLKEMADSLGDLD